MVPPLAPDLSRTTRWALATVGAGLLALLATAAWLTPNVYGRGTHQQLGLPPCTFLLLIGKPCPSCGMTTSWSHVVRGQLPQAVCASAGGTVLALASLVAAPWLLVSAARGRFWGGTPSDRGVATVAMIVAAITIIDWLRRW